MKGLKHPPSPRSLKKAYHILQSTEQKLKDRSLVRYSQWVRLDPRLGELMVAHIARYWRQYQACVLNRLLRQVAWPCAFGVLLSQVPLYCQKQQKNYFSSLFQKWSRCVMKSVPRGHGSLFFFHLFQPATARMQKEVLYSQNCYKQWGYFGRDLMINKAASLKKDP